MYFLSLLLDHKEWLIQSLRTYSKLYPLWKFLGYGQEHGRKYVNTLRLWWSPVSYWSPTSPTPCPIYLHDHFLHFSFIIRTQNSLKWLYSHQLALEVPCFHFISPRIKGELLCSAHIYVGSKNLNSGPQACRASDFFPWSHFPSCSTFDSFQLQLQRYVAESVLPKIHSWRVSWLFQRQKNNTTYALDWLKDYGKEISQRAWTFLRTVGPKDGMRAIDSNLSSPRLLGLLLLFLDWNGTEAQFEKIFWSCTGYQERWVGSWCRFPGTQYSLLTYR